MQAYAPTLVVLFTVFIGWSAIVWLLVLATRQYLPKVWNWSRLWLILLPVTLTPLLPGLQLPTAYLLPASLLEPLPALTIEAANWRNPVQQLAREGNPFPLATLAFLVALLSISLYHIVRFLYSLQVVGYILRTSKRHNGIPCLPDKLNTMLASRKIELQVTDMACPPFVFGFIRPQLILPSRVLTLPPASLEILVAHELTHIERKDPQAVLLFRFFACLFWFNPFIRMLEQRYLSTMELDCDNHTINRHQFSGLDYAHALINSLKLLKGSYIPAGHTAFFGDNSTMALQQRITCATQAHQQSPLRAPSKWFIGAAATLLACASIGVKSELLNQQPTLAENSGLQPVANARLTSTFKAKQAIRNNKLHKGIDLAAPKGTAVVASFGGIVVIADDTSLHANYGKTVVIKHEGNFQTVYAHLDAISVSANQVISAGEALGTVGETGKATGPHLHFEVLHEETPQDPQLYLAKNSAK